MKIAWQLEREKLLQYISPILQFLRCVSAKSLFLPAGRQIPMSLFFFSLVLIFVVVLLLLVRLVLGVEVIFIVHLQGKCHSLTKANTQNTTEWSGQEASSLSLSSVTTSLLPQTTSKTSTLIPLLYQLT